MSETVRVKSTNKIGHVECYEGNGEYIITLEDGTQGWFNEHELEFLNFEPYPNLHHKAIQNLILIINNTRTFDCMDIDNENFITFICEKSGLKREDYMNIMELDDTNTTEEDDSITNAEIEFVMNVFAGYPTITSSKFADKIERILKQHVK